MMNKIIESDIQPTDVKIYIEDDTPYLDYTGTCYVNGSKCKIHLPKIGLSFSKIEQEKDVEEYSYWGYKQEITMSFNIFASDGKYYKFEILERKMSKEQIEKELGYKINIKEN